MTSSRITLVVIMLVYCGAFCAIKTKAAPVISRKKVTQYFSQLGYTPPVNSGSERIIAEEVTSTEIFKFQSFITGKMNAETTQIIAPQRCGVEDILRPRRGDRLKRYALHVSEWRRKSLTYKISKYPRKLKRTTVDAEISKALAVWSEYTDLSFTPDNETIDIDIRFERGDHGDGKPFDGWQGEILAHAFYPWFGGDVHFDDDEEWTMNSNTGTNLFQVAAHEFGHSLGLRHSTITSAVMSPAYKSYDPNFMLDSDDIEGIQAIYGPRTVDEIPQLCTGPQIDAIFKSPEGHTYAFKGKYYWKLMAGGIAYGYPKLIARTWSRLPGNIDTAIAHKNGKTFFFKGSKYWRYVGNRMDGNYPREINDGFSRTLEDTLTRFKLLIKTNRLDTAFAMTIRCSLYSTTGVFRHKQK